jgi:hypothetical protein
VAFRGRRVDMKRFEFRFPRAKAAHLKAARPKAPRKTRKASA